MNHHPVKSILPWSPPARRQRPRGPEAAWRTVRTIAALFLLVVSSVLVAGHLGKSAVEPLKSPELAQLKEKLRVNPSDQELKLRIRQVDLQMREVYFRQLSLNTSGVRLLLGGLVVFIVASTQAARYLKQPLISKQKIRPEDTVA